MLTFYLLIWPLLSALVLFVIVWAFIKEIISAKKNRQDIV